MCVDPNILDPAIEAGFHCFVDGNPTGIDSNDGATSSTCSETNPTGEWISYTCLEAEGYWQTVDGMYIML